MQISKSSHIRNTKLRALPMLLLLTLSAAGVCADEVKTTVRKAPYPTAPESERPKKISLETAFSRWTVKVVWDKLHGVENCFEARFVTSDVIAGLTNQLVKDGQLTDSQAQTLYDDRRKKYYGSADRGAFGEKIAFLGHIELSSETYTVGQLNAPWKFELLADDGKPVVSAKVEMGEVRLQKNAAAGSSSWRRAFTVTFDNQDLLTKRRVVTAGVHALTLVVKGAVGEGRATFAFDAAAH